MWKSEKFTHLKKFRENSTQIAGPRSFSTISVNSTEFLRQTDESKNPHFPHCVS